MRLSRLLESENRMKMQIPDQEITSITDDNRKVQKDCIFVCIKGETFDGHSVAQQAVAQGAAVVIAEHDVGLGDRQMIVPDSREFYGQLCAAWFDHPERKMKFIGVTGTNGKTTITNVIKAILTANHHKVGLIGTIQNEIGDEILHTDNTTPMVFDLMTLYDRMYRSGCDTVVMEVSSFGLVQKRIGLTHFDTAVFTNLTQDHLDYHKTMENYYQAKKMLFTVCDRAIINTDDDYGKRLYDEITCEKYSYGKSGDYAYQPVSVKASGTTFLLNGSEIRMHMTGYFNIANATAAYLACRLAGLESTEILPTLQACPGVKGRCEVIPTGKDFSVICDYAHTPDAVENILENVKLYTEHDLICLFGCGGNRDRTKRPLMAQAAAKFADRLIITSDNPRDEDPDAIIQDILTGLQDNPAVKYEIVTDRREAIAHAIRTAQPGDVIVLAGKGHEDYQIFSNNYHTHFDEREVVAEILKNSEQ
ncbi:MAG: UDP-N-acetylmuramoyl-L-alanyl-D-glutamate--2,6-diaminopimelate ligase [Oscillospiraceae bacterium]|nr:UDP-N-acetylmuramoyl-L-alanyl-D-glutamate--2,6-diaminopimelate ligase [Oscillospiraceae bacterium]